MTLVKINIKIFRQDLMRKVGELWREKNYIYIYLYLFFI